MDPLKVHLSDLRSLSLFEGLSLLRLRALLPFCRKRILPKNTVLFLEDEPATHLYFVLKGSVAVTLEIDGHRATVYDVHERQCVDWSALVEPYQFWATSQCTQLSLVLEIDAISLRRRMEKDLKLTSAVMSEVARIMQSRLQDTRRLLIERLAIRAPEALAEAHLVVSR